MRHFWEIPKYKAQSKSAKEQDHGQTVPFEVIETLHCSGYSDYQQYEEFFFEYNS